MYLSKCFVICHASVSVKVLASRLTSGTIPHVFSNRCLVKDLPDWSNLFVRVGQATWENLYLGLLFSYFILTVKYFPVPLNYKCMSLTMTRYRATPTFYFLPCCMHVAMAFAIISETFLICESKRFSSFIGEELIWKTFISESRLMVNEGYYLGKYKRFEILLFAPVTGLKIYDRHFKGAQQKQQSINNKASLWRWSYLR